MEEQLLLKIQQLRRRLRWVQCSRAACRWGLWGFWMALLLGALLKLLDRPLVDQLSCLWAFPAMLAGGALVAWMRPPTLKQAALRTDQRKTLKERMITALDTLGKDGANTATSRLLLEDAWQHAQRLDPREVFPNPWVRPALRWTVPALLCGLLLATPSWGSWLSPIAVEEVAAVRRSGQRIGQLADRLRRQHPHSPLTQNMAKKLEELGRELKDSKIHRATAAEKIDQANRELARMVAANSSSQKSTQSQGKADNSALKELSKEVSKAGGTAQNKDALQRAISKSAEGRQKEALEEAARQLEKGNKQDAAGKIDEAAQHEPGEEQGEESEAGAEAEEQLQSESQALEPGSPHPGAAGPGKARQASVNRPSPGRKGEGEGQADFGSGTTNQEEKGKAGKKKDYVLERQHNRKLDDWKERYEQLYRAERSHLDQANSQLRGQRGKGRVIRTQGHGWGAPRKGGGPTVSAGAGEVYLRSKQGAEQAISQGTVPGEYRESVRNYFDQIDPRR